MLAFTDPVTGMLPSERRAVLFLALIYAVRMIGLFIMLPVLVLYGATLDHADPRLLGLAMGIYGLTQAVLQIPYGVWSDRYGRHRVILIGLLVFAAGSMLAAQADTIYTLILGRALQGAGAIAGVVMALAADLTRVSQRSKAMAAIGASIGGAFLLSIVLGPVLYAAIGGNGIFYLTVLLAVMAIALLYWGVPQVTAVASAQAYAPREFFSAVFANSVLLRINAGIFMLHAVLIATFIVVPSMLRNTIGLPVSDHGWLYLPAMIAGLCLMLPCLIYAEKTDRIRILIIVATLLLVLSQAGWISGYGKTLYGFVAFLFLFFLAFNALEAVFPSLASKIAVEHRGAALGLYSTCQFLGAFTGGVMGGWVLKTWGDNGVFAMAMLFALLWLPVAFGIRMLPGLDCYTVNF
ncbi:MAG TPA: MFS transporter, partial [Gammaproteobacteria bacterium]